MAARRMRPDLMTPTRRLVLGGLAAGLTGPAFAAPPPEGDWTPFDDSHGLIAIRGAINGRPVDLTLDSGAGRVVIDAAFARDIGLEILDSAGALHGLAESRPGGLSGPVIINVGGGDLRLKNAVLADLSSLRAAGYDAPVILGRDIFELASVDLDFARNRVAFRQHGSFDVSAFRRTPLRTRRDVPQLQVSIEGRRPAWATLDLGSATPVTISRAYAQSLGVLDSRPRSQWLSSGVDGITRYDVATVSGVEVAGLRLRDVPIDIYPVWNRTATVQANVGYPLLRRLGRIIVDYRSDAMFATRTPPPPEPFGKNRLGLALIDLDGGGYRVALVAPGSPADQGGWREGEVIAAINGQRAMSRADRSALGQRTRVTFTMADGATRELSPATYY